MVYNVVWLPKSIEKQLPLAENSRLRVDVEVAGGAFNRALQPANGKWFILLSGKFMKAHGVALGNRIEIGFNVADQDAVEVPDELREALLVNDDAYTIWNELTAGKRRSHAFRVASAIRPETRQRRVIEVIDNIITGNTHRW